MPCPQSANSCAAPTCEKGLCGFRPDIDAPCGKEESGRCNEGYACIGTSARLTAIRQHTCAVADDGNVWCWGGNRFGELGDGTTEDRATPVLVKGLPRPAIDASAGYAHTCALLEDGRAYCWGNNLGGQTDPASSRNPVTEPTLVDAPVHFTTIHAGQGHTCGISTDRTVYCWGNTAAGQCGVEPTESVLVGPTKIPGLDKVISMETVKNHSCAVRSEDPTLMCWGSNQYLEKEGSPIIHKLGPAADALEYSAVPIPADLGKKIVDVGMGYESTHALSDDGFVFGWGFNGRGQIGSDVTDTVVPAPVLVMTAPGVPLQGAVDLVRTDNSDECARIGGSIEGSPYDCWGADDNGELGFGGSDFDQKFAAPAAALPASATNLVRGEGHGCLTATQDERVQILCYGQVPLVANGSLDPFSDQPIPTPILWDPKNFSATTE